MGATLPNTSRKHLQTPRPATTHSVARCIHHSCDPIGMQNDRLERKKIADAVGTTRVLLDVGRLSRVVRILRALIRVRGRGVTLGMRVRKTRLLCDVMDPASLVRNAGVCRVRRTASGLCRNVVARHALYCPERGKSCVCRERRRRLRRASVSGPRDGRQRSGVGRHWCVVRQV